MLVQQKKRWSKNAFWSKIRPNDVQLVADGDMLQCDILLILDSKSTTPDLILAPQLLPVIRWQFISHIACVSAHKAHYLVCDIHSSQGSVATRC